MRLVPSTAVCMSFSASMFVHLKITTMSSTDVLFPLVVWLIEGQEVSGIHKVFCPQSWGGAPLFSNVSIVPKRARNLMSSSQESDSAWQPFTRWYGLLVFGLLRSLLKEEVTAVPWDDLVLFFRWMSMAQLCPLNMVLYHDVPVCYVELAWISMN